LGATELAAPIGAVAERLKEGAAVWDRPFVLIPHRPNYLLPVSTADGLKASPSWTPASSNSEVKFQVSFRFPVSPAFLNKSAVFLVGYTGTAWWQAYNREESSPFREYNHEPEFMFALQGSGLQFLGITHRATILSFNHQSNGKTGAGSRSWNRLVGEALFERGSDFWVSARAWYRIPEGSNRDDNPDITDYLGNAEFKVGGKSSWGDLTLTGRNWGRKPFTQLEWSNPIPGLGNLRWYAQLSTGCGESLIEYNVRVRRLGVGVALSDYF
jgi:phospholipase A1